MTPIDKSHSLTWFMFLCCRLVKINPPSLAAIASQARAVTHESDTKPSCVFTIAQTGSGGRLWARFTLQTTQMLKKARVQLAAPCARVPLSQPQFSLCHQNAHLSVQPLRILNRDDLLQLLLFPLHSTCHRRHGAGECLPAQWRDSERDTRFRRRLLQIQRPEHH